MLNPSEARATSIDGKAHATESAREVPEENATPLPKEKREPSAKAKTKPEAQPETPSKSGAAKQEAPKTPKGWKRALEAAVRFVQTAGILDEPAVDAGSPASKSSFSPSDPGALGVGDSCILPPAAATKPVPPEIGVVGHSRAIAVPDMLGVLSSLQKSGTFWVWNERECYRVRLSGGKVVAAQSETQAPGLLLGQILVLQNAIEEDQLARFLEMRTDEKAPIGEALKKAGLVGDAEIREAILYQAQRIFNRAYNIKDAWFRFDPNVSEDMSPRFGMSVTQLLLESARTRDETEERLEGVLGDPFAGS